MAQAREQDDALIAGKKERGDAGTPSPNAEVGEDSHHSRSQYAVESASFAQPTATPWFYNLAFRGYWDHWRHVQSWLAAAKYAYDKSDRAKADALRRNRDFQLQSIWPSHHHHRHPVSGQDENDDPQAHAKDKRRKMRADRRKNQKRNKKLKEKKARRTREVCSDGEEEEEVEGLSGEGPDGGIEAQCHDQEEFLKLLAQNHAFRQKRDAYKREEEEKMRRKDFLSSRAPIEQAGLKRTREMSDLYGGESILIQTLETNLQMKFDQFSDTHQPPIWPSIPLNLRYGR